MKVKLCSVLLIAGVLALYSPPGRASDDQGGPDKKTVKKTKKAKKTGPSTQPSPYKKAPDDQGGPDKKT